MPGRHSHTVELNDPTRECCDPGTAEVDDDDEDEPFEHAPAHTPRTTTATTATAPAPLGLTGAVLRRTAGL